MFTFLLSVSHRSFTTALHAVYHLIYISGGVLSGSAALNRTGSPEHLMRVGTPKPSVDAIECDPRVRMNSTHLIRSLSLSRTGYGKLGISCPHTATPQTYTQATPSQSIEACMTI